MLFSGGCAFGFVMGKPDGSRWHGETEGGVTDCGRPANMVKALRAASLLDGTENDSACATTGNWNELTFMPEPKCRRNRRAERLLKEVLRERFTFEASRADLELLRSIHEGTYANTKPGDPSFHAYAAAVNLANEFAGQVLGFPDLIPFNNLIADIQEEYMPSYPPMSPVTSAFFAG